MHALSRQHTSAHACIWPGSELWPGGTLGIYIYMLLSALSVYVTVHKECTKYYHGLPKTDHSSSKDPLKGPRFSGAGEEHAGQKKGVLR